MSRAPRDRLLDMLRALDTIDAHLSRGPLTDGLVFDAVRVRLIEIGEAVKGVPSELLESDRSVPWSDIARMRDVLSHHYFDTSHAILEQTARNDLPRLRAAVERLLDDIG